MVHLLEHEQALKPVAGQLACRLHLPFEQAANLVIHIFADDVIGQIIIKNLVLAEHRMISPGKGAKFCGHTLLSGNHENPSC